MSDRPPSTGPPTAPIIISIATLVLMILLALAGAANWLFGSSADQRVTAAAVVTLTAQVEKLLVKVDNLPRASDLDGLNARVQSLEGRSNEVDRAIVELRFQYDGLGPGVRRKPP